MGCLCNKLGLNSMSEFHPPLSNPLKGPKHAAGDLWRCWQYGQGRRQAPTSLSHAQGIPLPDGSTVGPTPEFLKFIMIDSGSIWGEIRISSCKGTYFHPGKGGEVIRPLAFLTRRRERGGQSPVQLFPQFFRRNKMDSLDTEKGCAFNVSLGIIDEENLFRLYR